MFGASGEIRTPDSFVRSEVLLSTELRRHCMAGVLGFEPRITESKSVVLPLHYTPTKIGPGSGIRTHDLLLPKQAL